MKEADFMKFEEVAEKMIEWIKENGNIHTKVVVDCEQAEVLQGNICIVRRINDETNNIDG